MTMFGRNKQKSQPPRLWESIQAFRLPQGLQFCYEVGHQRPSDFGCISNHKPKYRGAKCQGAQHQAEWSTSNKFTTTIQFPVYGGRWNKSDIAKGKPVPGPVEGIPSPSQMVDSWNNIVVGWSERFPPLLTKDIAIDLATPYPEIDPAKQMKKLKPGILAQTSTHNAAGYVATNVFIGVPVPNFVRVLHCFRPLKDLVDAVAAQHPAQEETRIPVDISISINYLMIISYQDFPLSSSLFLSLPLSSSLFLSLPLSSSLFLSLPLSSSLFFQLPLPLSICLFYHIPWL